MFSRFGSVKRVDLLGSEEMDWSSTDPYAYIHFDDQMSARNARQFMSGLYSGGKELIVFWVFDSNLSQTKAKERLSMVLVQCLSASVEDHDLRQVFERSLAFDLRTKEFKGFGFVSFGRNSEAEEAVALMNGLLFRCTLIVEEGICLCLDSMSSSSDFRSLDEG